MATGLEGGLGTEYSSTLKQLIKLTNDKLNHLKAILNLTHEQTSELNADEMDKLLSLIDDKQKHIEAIDTLDVEFDSIYTKIQPLFAVDMNTINPELKANLKELKEAVMAVTSKMQEIRALEQDNNAAIKQNFDELKDQLKSVNRGIKGYTAYKKPEVQNGGVFFDKKK